MTITTAHPFRLCPRLLSGLGHCPRCRAAHAAVMRRHRAKRRAVSRENAVLAQGAMISGFLSEAA